MTRYLCRLHGQLELSERRQRAGAPVCVYCLQRGEVRPVTVHPGSSPKRLAPAKALHVPRSQRDYIRKPSPILRTMVYRRDGHKCLKCGSEKALTCDHIVPHSHGGATTLGNLQTLCRRCNGEKGESHDDYRRKD